MRELTNMEQDAVAGGNGLFVIVPIIGNGSVGRNSNNTGVQSGGAFNEIGSINNNNSGNVSVNQEQHKRY